jgi:hypothetical protein
MDKYIKTTTVDNTILVRLHDALNGSPKTGLTITDLQVKIYTLNNTNDVSLVQDWTSLTALAGLTSSHSDNYGIELDSGYYRVDIPDASVGVDITQAIILIKDNTNESILEEDYVIYTELASVTSTDAQNILDKLNDMIIEDSGGNQFTEAAFYNHPSVDVETVLNGIPISLTNIGDEVDSSLVDYGANTTVPDVAGTAAALHSITDGKIDVVDANVDFIASVADKLNDMIIEDSGGNQFTEAAFYNHISADDVVDALFAKDGFTIGGSMTYEKLLTISASIAAGNWRVKTGVDNTYELLDVDDGTTVILEQVVLQTGAIKSVTLKI